MSDGRIVWDSDSGQVGDGPSTHRKGKPQKKKQPAKSDGIARVRRETGGRKGKTVTTIAGVPVSAKELTALAKQLKQLCGVGGSVKDSVIELQGDQRDRVVEYLQAKGHQVLRAGG
ncbi:MAG: stress response translation initiation inhibitor YciH [Planctomycetota bacterium]|jgi:translation initiation factor 1